MDMDKSVFVILSELDSTSGSLAKRAILDEHVKNDLLRRAFVAAGDPYVVYYVNKFKVPLPSAEDDCEFGDDEALEGFLSLLNDLSSRKFTGNAAKDAITSFFRRLDHLQQVWCERILLKNLRIGVQSTVNKVWPGAIRTFDVALAETLRSDFVRGKGIQIIDEVTYPVRVEPKLDGLRLIAIKRRSKVTLYTRNGNELDTLPRIVATLEASPFNNFVLDGEGMGDDWNESNSIMMAKKTKKDDSKMTFNVFDALPLEDWDQGKSTMAYAARVELVDSIVKSCEFGSPIVQVPHVDVVDEGGLKAYFAECMDVGFEGVMLKTLDTPYVFKRSKNILKLKPCVTYEGVIVGHYEGRRGTKREGLFGGFEVVLPNGVITRVGGGFNDALKASIQLEGPDGFLGKIVEIEAQPDPLTTTGLTKDGKARFPVFTRFRNEGDVDPSVVAAGVAHFEKDGST